MYHVGSKVEAELGLGNDRLDHRPNNTLEVLCALLSFVIRGQHFRHDRALLQKVAKLFRGDEFSLNRKLIQV
jgi:hypothetical protein